MGNNLNSLLPSEILARKARIAIAEMIFNSRASHIGSCYSVVDILSVLYTYAIKRDISEINSADRDILILSKGHAAAALYAVLAHEGIVPIEELDGYCSNGALMGGHVTAGKIPGVEFSTGALGHGFPHGVGLALWKKKIGAQGKVFVVLSDGECDEGTTWESALIAAHHNLDNLIVIIDRNGLQSLTSTENTLALEPLDSKWISFGWRVESCDGHDHKIMRDKMSDFQGPLCLIAKTVKGKGVSFMQDSVLWHYRAPNESEFALINQELNI